MSMPHMMPPPDGSLRDILRDRRTAARIADAEFIRDAPAGEERDQEACRVIRETMLLFALRRITNAERDRILDILSFVAVHEFPPRPERPPHPYFDDLDTHGPLA